MSLIPWSAADERGRQLFGLLAGLDLPLPDHAVFGSGPLIVRGIVPAGSDLDVICRGPAWEAARRLGPLVHDADHDVALVELYDGAITFGVSWGIGRFDIGMLIDTAEVIDGIPFVRLEHVIAYKQASGRTKDAEHLRLLDTWRRAHP
ncbi:MAG: hypothetical protein A2Z12_02565 [Actinobacteria bacterium RBG_16_68_21]|nr:MAG: hypothetical protein A2Z12_02565 [Actinobacteria bacterium RBG_16_68_21]